MAVKIRLARHGHKGYAFYYIVVANSKSPRDGRFIEKIGTYNPNTNPATIVLDMEKSLQWLKNGAQPTDTVRNIFSAEGVLLKKHLLGGVAKGAFDEAEAEKRFEAWKAKKAEAQNKTTQNVADKKAAAKKAQLDAEAKINADRAKALEEKKLEAAKAKAEAEAAANAAEAPAEEAAAPAQEAPAAE